MTNNWKRPLPLRSGQKVTVLAPAGRISPAAVTAGLDGLREWGLAVETGEHLFALHHQFAGTDAQRLADLQRALDDPETAAIICARGGYGTTRIIDDLDFTAFLRQPKWLVGYSDITTLHLHLHRLGVESLHATMPLLFGRDTPFSIESLRNLLFGGEIAYRVAPHALNRPGEGSGVLVGGNLALLVSNVGTASDVDTRGKVLFLEDINEYLYSVDRMMVQLKRTGKLDGLAGLVVGHFSDSKDNDIPFGKDPHEIVADAVREYGFPVCYGFPVGHEPENWAMPCGRTVHLAVGPAGATLSSAQAV
ncbi:MAG: Muramoyltetrapeptide carboxypeptidase [uncultured Cytophagales bacterium]|uniref:Muramoyltetrapeptide carboxypeptidase n=1 Tax=uncultured Cytophagales bacterium TaxID=158755 RepID=A0A6J4ID11_9SPHI|nr:MAG: Muramoyltetrapeptide carboxypeptidase [uncultured Cytophagales bacterium]